MAMLLEHSGHPAAGKRIDTAVAHITGTKMKSQAAGKMGYGTREVGDLVVAALS
jgi:3-isopropylmalate dehydrogenase